MSRFDELPDGRMGDLRKRVHDEIAAGPRGTVPPPHQVWLRAPGFCEVAHRVGEYCRWKTTLPAALSELAILVGGRHWQAEYEWWAHARIARENGLPDAVIEAIRIGETPDFTGTDPRAEIIYVAAKEMLETKGLSDATYARALEELGAETLVEVVGIVGYYCLISLTLNVFQVETPDGSKPFADVKA